jgi:hypothetical protein
MPSELKLFAFIIFWDLFVIAVCVSLFYLLQ